MPRNAKRIFRRRRTTRRWGRKARKAYAPRNAVTIRGLSGSFLPQRAMTVHKYSEVVLRNSTSGIMDDYQFNLNSMYDPNRTAGGHQPMGRDQMAGFYNRYRVDKVVCKVTFIKYSEGVALWAAMAANNSSASFVNPLTAVAEQPYMLTSRTTSANGASKANLTFKKTVDLAKLTGVTKRKYQDDDRYQADIGSDPVENLIMHVCGCDLLETTTLTYALHVELQFHTTWFDPFVVGQS